MDVWGAILVLVRRFYITVPLAALTLLAGWSFTHNVAPEYHAVGSAVLVGPTAQEPPRDAPPLPVNPYVGLGLGTVATALELDVQNVASQNAIAAAGNTSQFAVQGVGKTAIMQVTSTSTDPQQALSTTGQVIAMMQKDLSDRQQQYVKDPTQQITLQIISPPQIQPADTTNRVRAEAIAIGVALLVTILLVLLIDAMLGAAARRRRARHQRHLNDDDVRLEHNRIDERIDRRIDDRADDRVDHRIDDRSAVGRAASPPAGRSAGRLAGEAGEPPVDGSGRSRAPVIRS